MEQDRAKVFVLGTFHMSEHEGLNSEKRQSEMEDLAVRLYHN